MFMEMQTLKDNQDRILQMMSGNLDNSEDDDLDQLEPLQTLEQFDALEDELQQSREKRVKMVI